MFSICTYRFIFILTHQLKLFTYVCNCGNLLPDARTYAKLLLSLFQGYKCSVRLMRASKKQLSVISNPHSRSVRAGGQNQGGSEHMVVLKTCMWKKKRDKWFQVCEAACNIRPYFCLLIFFYWKHIHSNFLNRLDVMLWWIFFDD